METPGANEANSPGAAPPSPPPPPVLYPPPPPPVIRKGRGWKYLALILLVLLVLNNLGSLEHFLGGALGVSAASRTPADQLEEVVMEDQGVPEKILLINLRGLIYGGYVGGGESDPVEFVRWQLERAEKDDQIKAVVLRVDSPGGEVLASDNLSRLIEDFQTRTGKPVVGSLGGVAASGGYYVAASCRWLVASPLTITGSIGVIMHGYNYRGLMDKVGVKPMVFKSGRFKDMLSGERAETEIPPEERKMVQDMIQTTFARFKEVVARGRRKAQKRNQGRGRALAGDWQKYADGRVLLGTEAYELGFVDELGDFRAAVSRARDLAGVGQANLVRYQAPFRWGGLLSLLSEARAPKIHLDLGVQAPPLEPGRAYFLYAPGL
jgi:protease-4